MTNEFDGVKPEDFKVDENSEKGILPLKLSGDIVGQIKNSYARLKEMDDAKQKLHDELWGNIVKAGELHGENDMTMDTTYMDTLGFVIIKKREPNVGNILLNRLFKNWE